MKKIKELIQVIAGFAIAMGIMYIICLAGYLFD